MGVKLAFLARAGRELRARGNGPATRTSTDDAATWEERRAGFTYGPHRTLYTSTPPPTVFCFVPREPLSEDRHDALLTAFHHGDPGIDVARSASIQILRAMKKRTIPGWPSPVLAVSAASESPRRRCARVDLVPRFHRTTRTTVRPLPSRFSDYGLSRSSDKGTKALTAGGQACSGLYFRRRGKTGGFQERSRVAIGRASPSGFGRAAEGADGSLRARPVGRRRLQRAEGGERVGHPS